MAASREEVFERVKEVLTEQLGVDEGEITEEASFQEDLDADSLDLVELIMELEDQFGIKISSTRSSESATRSSWNEASSVISPSTTPSCSVRTSFTRSKTSSRDAAMSPHVGV